MRLVSINTGLPREVPRVLGGSAPQDAGSVRLQEPSPKEGVRLSDTERSRLTEILTHDVKDSDGLTLHARLAALIATPEYTSQTDGRDGGKAYLVRKTFAAYLAEAEARFEQENPAIGETILKRKQARIQRLIPAQP